MPRRLPGPLTLALLAVLGCDDARRAPADGAELPRAPVELLVERWSRAGARSFYTMAPDGSRVAPFDGIPGDALAVAPSPDGRTLALLRATEHDVHLWLADRDGTNARPLLAGVRVVHSVAWSPDGRRLAYVESTLDTSQDLWVIRADGTGAVNLTPDPRPAIVSDASPAWSPDGERLAFVSSRSGTTRLWVIDDDGGGARQVIAPEVPGSERTPAWSADGSLVAFRSDSPEGSGIAVVRPDGTGYRLLVADAGAVHPAWSPDGRLLHATDASGNFELHALDLASGASTNLTRHAAHDHRATPLRHVAPGAWRGLAAAARYEAGAPGTPALAAGDLVTDGLPDLFALAPAREELRLLRATGEGAFTPAGGLEAPFAQRAIAIADVSRDGAPDAIVLGADALHVYRGGVEGPGLPTTHPLPGDAGALDLADVDEDGSTDVVAVHARGEDPFHVAVFSTRPDGVLVWTLDATMEHGGAAAACAADVTGDGPADVLVFTTEAGAAAVLLPGRGDMSFEPAVVAASGLAVPAAAVVRCADLDGDRRADVVLLAPGDPAGAAVLRSTGPGLEAPLPLGAAGTDVAAADLDRDGDVDLAVVGPTSPDVRFLRNRGDGRFAAPVHVPLGGAPLRVAAADLDGDGWTDLAVADEDGTIAVLRNAGAARP